MSGALDREDACRRGNERGGGAELGDRAERVGGALDEQCRYVQLRKVLGPQAVRFPGRVKRIEEEQQSRDKIGLVRREQGGLPAAIGLTAEKARSRHDAAQGGHRLSEAGTVGGGAGGRGRTGRAALAER